MKATDIALGFANTVDYELDWDVAHLQKLIIEHGIHAQDIQNINRISTVRELLMSILYHIARGSGCGMFVENEALISEFIAGLKYKVTLGGTNVRASIAIARMGYPSYLHLVSVNDDIAHALPACAEWVCSSPYGKCNPHIVIQFPKNAHIQSGDIDVVAPNANRVIYSHDTFCSNLKIAPTFFRDVRQCAIAVLCSFDIMQEARLLCERLEVVESGIQKLNHDALIFYEDACFTSTYFRELVQNALLPYIDVYSMNEDEFQQLCGKTLDMLDAQAVLAGLQEIRARLPGPVLVVHTAYWVIAYGAGACRFSKAICGGVTMAATRYRLGDDYTSEDYEQTLKMPVQAEADDFLRRLQDTSTVEMRCQAAYEINPVHVTTIGLGDSFVGGFALGYARKDA